MGRVPVDPHVVHARHLEGLSFDLFRAHELTTHFELPIDAPGDTTPRGSPETHYELDTEVAAELDLAEEW